MNSSSKRKSHRPWHACMPARRDFAQLAVRESKMDLEKLDEGTINQAGFRRQRRNLLVVSFVLTAGLWVGISFEPLKEITIHGHKLLFLARPERISHLVWGLWLYFLIRYVAFHYQIQGGENLVNTFLQSFRNVPLQVALSAASKQGISPSVNQIEPIRVTLFGASCDIHTRPYGGTAPWGEPIKLTIRRTAILSALIRTFTKSIFGMVSASEYSLPYIVALLPLVIIAVKSFL